jgi:hypothetical protein
MRDISPLSPPNHAAHSRLISAAQNLADAVLCDVTPARIEEWKSLHKHVANLLEQVAAAA